MNKINILDKHTSELIAAGEVVERPSSVVKELVENSVDAKANQITVEIKNGGMTYIRITDDGFGMSEEDAKICFFRHSTSKIKSEIDLNAIFTMGFRGEALAAISAVSRTELFTKEELSLSGSHISVEGGIITECGPAGCPKGTTIVVKDLFYNTPARLSFMKKDSTEAAHIMAVVEKTALSNPHISFRFIKDGKEELYTAGDGNLLSVIYSVLGRESAKQLLEIEYTYNDIMVKGYISKPLFARGNRNLQYFFVNGRVIRSRLLTAALEEGYKNSIMVGKFPICVVNIILNPQKTDVNVHPSKQEIKFSDEKSIFDALYFSVKTFLDKETQRKEIEFKPVNENLLKDTFLQDDPISNKTLEYFSLLQNLERPKEGYPLNTSFEQTKAVSSFNDNISYSPTYSVPSLKEEKHEEQPQAITAEIQKQTDDFNLIGEIFKTYILAQTAEELLLIDKHAAHERIIFEKFKDKSDEIYPQVLLCPITVNLSAEEKDAILCEKDILSELCFLAEDFGAKSLLIREIPSILDEEDTEGAILQIAEIIRLSKGAKTFKAKDDLFHSIACKAAIKSGTSMNEREQYLFVKKLLSLPDIKYCPHGRPVMVSLSKGQLERMFKR